MQVIDIKNPRVLSLLENFRSFIEKYDVINNNTKMEDAKDSSPKSWVSSEYRDYIIGLGKLHEGGPTSAKSFALKPEHYHGSDPNYKKDFIRIDESFIMELGLKCNALSQLYPPEGYIAWHNNANAAGYNLIFTWSETGDGWFKYVNKYGKEITLPDKKGWSLKAGYFGDYESGKLCYHAAYTKCLRITQAFVVSDDDKDYWDDCINYISGD
jgi:hypothetical protein